MTDIDSDLGFNDIITKIITKAKNIGEGRRVLVGVCGIAGSGKTFISNAIVKQINQKYKEEGAQSDVAICLSMDGFHFTKAHLSKMHDPELAFKRRGAHWTFDSDGFVNTVKKLKQSNEKMLFPSFDHAKGDPEFDSISVDKAFKIVVIEGLYTCMTKIHPWNELLAVWDDTWYIKPKDDAKTLNRLALRHVETGLEDSIESALDRIKCNDGLNAETIVDNLPSSFSYTIYN